MKARYIHTFKKILGSSSRILGIKVLKRNARINTLLATDWKKERKRRIKSQFVKETIAVSSQGVLADVGRIVRGRTNE